MAECSKPYLEIVKTRTGLTPENPWRSKLGISMPSPIEYEEWHALALELTEAMYRHFVVLGDIETRKGTFPKWNEFVEESNSVRAAASDLPSAWGTLLQPDFSWIPDVERAISVATRAACLMEKIDAALIEYGSELPWSGVTPKGDDEPSQPSSSFSLFSDLWGIALGAGLLYGVFWLIQTSNKGDS